MAKLRDFIGDTNNFKVCDKCGLVFRPWSRDNCPKCGKTLSKLIDPRGKEDYEVVE